MTTISEMYDRVKSINVKNELPFLVQKTSYDIEALNKNQLYHGLRSDGYEIHPPYANKYYSRKKRAMNQKAGAGIPDLFLTGSFYKGFQVSVTKDTFEVDSVNDKSSSLKSKYSDKIFGLTNDSKREYALGAFFTALKEYIETGTGLKFR